MGARRGFSLTELLVTTSAAGFLAAALLPVISGVKDLGDRTACAANLHQLIQALRLYAADNDGYLPDCGAASPMGRGYVPDDGRHFPSLVNAPGTCAWPQVRAVGNQANLWMLVRQGYAAPRVFICPATADRPSLNSTESGAVMGFLALDPATGAPVPAEDRFLKKVAAGRCSYSYQVQFAHPYWAGGYFPGIPTIATHDYQPPPAPDKPCFEFATTHVTANPPGLAVLADRNPYTRTTLVRQPIVPPDSDPQANSLNHHGAGQNVVYLGGHVEWHNTPRCGEVRADGLPDNIYWPDEGPVGDPWNASWHPSDSFLAP